ncbi:MAG: cell division protein ZipA, partial [Rhodanobacter sp.]
MTLQPVFAFAWNPAVGIPLLVIGLIVLALIWLFGQPKKEQQGKRRSLSGDHGSERREPTVGGSLADDPVFTADDSRP